MLAAPIPASVAACFPCVHCGAPSVVAATDLPDILLQRGDGAEVRGTVAYCHEHAAQTAETVRRGIGLDPTLAAAASLFVREIMTALPPRATAEA